MRNISKGSELKDVFPILSIEDGFIISKAAEVTAAYRVILPEIFTMTGADYEEMHSVWLKALKVLPAYSIVHKQDWITKSKYIPSAVEGRESSFLSRSSDSHFYERPFFDHECYLFLTRTRKGRSRVESIHNMLVSGRIIPQDVDKSSLQEFSDAVDQVERIINDSSLMRLERLSAEDLLGTDSHTGLFEQHLSLSREKKKQPTPDILFEDGHLMVGDKHVCLYTVSNPENLPIEVATDRAYEPFSTEVTVCSLSFASPLGILLPCEHIYNQYVFIDDSKEILKGLESDANKMHSMSLVSSENAVNEEFLRKYIESANTYKLLSVHAHSNVIAWSEDVDGLNSVKNGVGSALVTLGCENIRQNLVDAPIMYWASIPGNAGDFPREETYLSFAENALCFFTGETAYRDSPSPFGIRMADRLSGRPVHVDLSEIWMKKGIIQNRNKFVLGGSGSGKSFFMNHMLREYYEQGTHIILVDMGDSYEGLCGLINQETKGRDGIYYSYTEESPISFNPFYTEDNVFDLEKRESLKTLILSLWKRDGGEVKPSEDVAVSDAVTSYLEKVKQGKVKPSFNTFYEFVRDEFNPVSGFEKLMQQNNVEIKDLFDVVNFLYVLAPFYLGGVYDYLLNSDEQLDLLNKRFVVFEIDKIRDNKVLFQVVTLVIMESFVGKMRRVRDQRKVLVLEEAWKAIAKEGMAEYVKYLYKTVRKYFGEVTVVTQEMDDIISSPIVKESIIANADCKILLDQTKNMNKFDKIQEVLGLTEKNKEQILSINRNLDLKRGKYKEVWFGWGGGFSAVYATEVCREEFYTYADQEIKLKVKQRTKQFGGNVETAIRSLVAEEREVEQ